MTAGVEHYPRHYEFAIGDNPSVAAPGYLAAAAANNIVPILTTDPDTVAVFQPVGILGNLFLIAVENRGAAAFVFSVMQSNDNGVTDAYAAINMRVGGSPVASVTVQPGGRVVLTLETVTKAWVRLKVPNASADAQTPKIVCPFGRVVVTHYNGDLNRAERTGIK